MSEFLTTKELADLLRLKERKVYDLAASGEVPCTRATGKLLFPRQAVMSWLQASGLPGEPSPKSRPKVFLGSHDPLLDWAVRDSQCGLATRFDSSEEGLERFESGQGVATGLHLLDPATDSWNITEISNRFVGKPVVLIRWATRKRGIVFEKASNTKITSVRDLARCRVVPRQSGAGAQKVLSHVLETSGLLSADLTLTEPAGSETDAALAIREGRADATLGLANVAFQFNLDFLPLIDEAFDLLIDRRAWFEPEFQSLLRLVQSARFRERAGSLPGYDVSECGTVLFNGA
ncbi:MAG: helix-turn-helix transcriptional regulator [Pseudomonadota bacterium]